jgi:hypothetical protein
VQVITKINIYIENLTNVNSKLQSRDRRMDMLPMCVLILLLLLWGKMLLKSAGFLRELLAKNECANNTAHKETA